MDDAALFDATVPVLRHYLDRMGRVLSLTKDADLAVSLADGMVPAGGQFEMAQVFALRTTYRLIGRAVPPLEERAATVEALVERLAQVRKLIHALAPADFAGSAQRHVQHVAGEASLDQPAPEYALHFGLPNFFFHLTAAYAVVRARGRPIGKSDFDGFHQYSPGVRF